MENGAANGQDGKDPSSFLSDIIGNAVTVKLNSGVVYKGEFVSLAEGRTWADEGQASCSLWMAT